MLSLPPEVPATTSPRSRFCSSVVKNSRGGVSFRMPEPSATTISSNRKFDLTARRLSRRSSIVVQSRPSGGQTADPPGAVPLFVGVVAALDRSSVVVGRGSRDAPPVPAGENILVFRPVLHGQQRTVGREVRQQVLPVGHLESDRAFGVHRTEAYHRFERWMPQSERQ